ncbi:MAG TPA: hypothetical protein VFG58_10625 [Solirubrobacterales bacterium]|nr:hypothetical protein [Solirubrobacterales bacterium]
MRQKSQGETESAPPSLPPNPRTLAGLHKRLWSSFQRWAAENPEAIARLWVWINDARTEDKSEPGLVTLVRSFVLNVAPPNWQSLPPSAHTEVDQLICRTGICLVWVPEADVIMRLLRALSKEARDDLLLDSAPLILDSITARLDEVAHVELTGLGELAREAVEAYRSGFIAPSQTAAAAVVSGVIEEHYGFKFGPAREAFEAETPATAGLWSHRRALVQRALQIAIVNSWRAPKDGQFNRHLTSHGNDPAHYSEVHAIEALMLMAGALRELNETYRVAEMGFGPSPQLTAYAEKRAAAQRSASRMSSRSRYG